MIVGMINFLHHYFLPKESNNYRPRILHNKILFLAVLFFFFSGVVVSLIKTNFPSVLGISSDVSNQQLLILTNSDRQQNGLPPLTDNPLLDQAAANKASDMFAKDYWAHDSPTGETPWDFIKAAGYNYVYAGENLARGYTTSQDVVSAWMASPEHRQNMLSSNYKNVGFAVATGKLNGEDTVLVVEMFGSTNLGQVANANPDNQVVKQVTSDSSPSKNTNTLGSSDIPSSKPAVKVTGSGIPSVKPLVDSSSTSLVIARFALSLFIFVLIMDMLFIERKKIVRFVGHNFDHILFLSIISLIILVISKGVIL